MRAAGRGRAHLVAVEDVVLVDEAHRVVRVARDAHDADVARDLLELRAFVRLR